MRTARRRWAPLMFVAAAVAIAVAPAAAAEFDKASWEIGAFVLYTTFDNDSTISDTFGFGARGGYVLAPRHEVELTLVTQSADEQKKGSEVTYDITRWDIAYVHNLKTKKPDSKLIPLIDFGVGTMSYDGRGSSDSTTTFKGGGGIRILFTKHLALRFDGNIWHFHGDGTIIPRDGWFSYDTTLGVSFVFGGGGA